MADNDTLKKLVELLEAYPILTREVGGAGRAAPTGGTAPTTGTAEAAIRDILGWRPRADDPRGFVAALNQAFETVDVEGHTELRWRTRTYAVQPDMGALTGAQASLHARAKAAIDQALPLLDGLSSLRSDSDEGDVEAIRAIIRSEMTELVTELGATGGPRVARVDQLFRFLLGETPSSIRGLTATDPEKIRGHLGILRERLGLSRHRVNTVEEEKTLTNFMVLVSHVDALMAGWASDRHYFNRMGPDIFLGTQLVLLNRDLHVVAESVDEVFDAMDSVYLSEAERQTIVLHDSNETPITVTELLEWVRSFATNEGPRLITDGGREGVLVVGAMLDRLHELVGDFMVRDKVNPVPEAFIHPRVKARIHELVGQLEDATEHARQIERRPTISVVTPSSAVRGSDVWLTINGTNLSDGAQVFLTDRDRDQGTVGKGDIVADEVLSIGPAELKARFTLRRLGKGDEGDWTLVVVNPDFTHATHPFEVTAAQTPPPPKPAPVVDKVDNPAPEARPAVKLTIGGRNFDSKAVARITAAGQEFSSKSRTNPEGTVVTAEFDLSKARPVKEASLVVVNPRDVESNRLSIEIRSPQQDPK